MKRARCLAMVLASLLLGCSSGGSHSGTPSTSAGGTNPGNGGTGGSSPSAGGSGGTELAGGRSGSEGSAGIGGGLGGVTALAGTTGAAGNTAGLGGSTGSGGATGGGGSTTGLGGSTTGLGGSTTGPGGSSGSVSSGGTFGSGGTAGKSAPSSPAGATAGSRAAGGSGGRGGTILTMGSGGAASSAGSTGSTGSGPVGVFTGTLAAGIAFMDTDGKPVNAHGGGIIREGDTFYIHGLFFPTGPTPDDFHGVAMYSSKDLATWKNEGIVFPQQASGELGPNRNCDRPHIIKCPSTGEFILTARASDTVTFEQDKEVVYATSPTVNGQYSYKGILKNASGQSASHSDMSAYADETGAYFITESGWVYPLASDCHTWVSGKQYSTVNGPSGGGEAPTVFKAGSTYYWIASYKTGWRCNNNFYSTAPAMTGPWTYQGYIAPVSDTSNDISLQRTWLSQTTWVQPVVGSKGTVYVYWGDHWDNCGATSGAGSSNYLATYVFQPLIFSDQTKTLLPTYLATWSLDVGAGTWSQ